MGQLKKLTGQTVYYGLSSMLGRLLNYLLVPIYTRVFINPNDLGIVTYLYAITALMNVLLTYGMETSFFRYSNHSDFEPQKVRDTAFTSLTVSTSVVFLVGLIFYKDIASTLDYGTMSVCILYFVFIIALDNFSVIPFAMLRYQMKAKRYAIIRLSGIALNIALNLLLVWLLPKLGVIELNVANIFLANVISSAFVLALLYPEIRQMKLKIDPVLWKKMLRYGLPILIAGTAGVINETMDRVFLKMLLPEDISEYWLGVYGNCFKIAIFITLFIQAFRFAAEPFFFSTAKDKNAPSTYAMVSKYFAMVVCAMYIGIMANLSWLQYFVGEDYRVGIDIVPIILYANICLGMYYNLSMWYKLTDRTQWGAYISIMGAVITVAVIFYGVPRFGYIAAAWSHLITYGSMMLVSYFLGQRFYPIPYPVGRIAIYMLLSWGFGYVSWYVLDGDLLVGNALFVIYLLIAAYLEKDTLKAFFPLRKKIN